jgi:peptide/nickel transport system substrate-binding protein
LRRTWNKRIAAVAVIALVVAACGGDDDATDTPDAEEPADAGDEPAADEPADAGDEPADDGDEPADEPADDGDEPAGDEPPEEMAGGTLRFVQLSEPATMNPVKSVIGDAAVWGSMFDRLIFIDDDLDLTKDGLVADWEAIDTTWRFTLREGVEFHNGEPWDAEAFKFTIDEYRNNPEGIMAGFMAGVTDVVIVDDTTVDVENAALNGAIPYLMATLFGLPPGYYTEVGETEFAAAPMGTGPFVFESYSPGTGVEVTANESYWRGRPSLDGVQFSWAGDEATRAALLESGDADVVDSLSVRTAARLIEDDNFDIFTIQTLRGLPMFLVDSKPPLDDPLLREAVARAIDPQAIVDAVFEGTGAVVMEGMLAPISAVVDAPPSAYDPDRAREILASLDEVPVIPFNYQVGRQVGDEDVAEVVVGMLEAVGFEVERGPQEYATLVGSVIAGEVNGMFDTSTFPVYLHPDVFASAFLSPTVSLTKSCLTEPRLDELRVAGVAATDPAEAGAIYSEMDFIATNELFCIVPTYLENRNYGLSADVQSFKARKDSVPDWFEASL